MNKKSIDDLMDLIEFKMAAHPEDMPIRGNLIASGDDAEDKRQEDAVIEDLENGNEWAWCVIEVKGEYLGLSASEFLGGCCYDSEDDAYASGVFDELKEQVAEQIYEQYRKIKED